MNAARSNIGAFVKNVIGLDPASNANTTRNGPAINREGYQSCALLGHIGATTGTPTGGGVTYKLQDSADGSTGWADLAGAAATQIAFGAINTGVEKDVDLGPAKKFIRVVEVSALTGGTTPTVMGSASVTLGGSADLPV